jgi:hypothetical protein
MNSDRIHSDTGNTKANVPANSKNDYSDWAKTCTMKECTAIFRKGTYGAYTVPVEEG